MKNLLNSLNGRLLCAAAVLFMVVGLSVCGAQPFAVGLFTEPWDKLAHATVFAVLTALLAVALQGKPAPAWRPLGFAPRCCFGGGGFAGGCGGDWFGVVDGAGDLAMMGRWGDGEMEHGLPRRCRSSQ